MTSVFLSYAREDLRFARRLHEALTRLGHAPAWDQDHGVVPVSSLYRDQISTAIAAAEKFVFVISPDSLESGPCADELAVALACRKQVIPMMRRRALPGQQIPAALADRNWIFFDDDERFDQGLAQLSEVLSTDLEWVRQHTWVLGRARQWSEGGSDRGALLRGGDLRQAEAWLAGADGHPETPPTAGQRQYVAASRRASDRFTRNLRTALASGLALSLALTAFALVQRSAAISERNEAIRQRDAAISGEVATETSGLGTTDPSLAAELNLAAYRISPTSTLRNRLLATENIPLATVLPGLIQGPGAAKPVNDVAFSARRHLLAASTSLGTVVLWDTTRPQRSRVLGSLRLGTGPVASVAFNPDSTLLAAQTQAGQVGLWDLADPVHPSALGTVETGEATSVELSFSPDGRLLAAGTDSGAVRLWDVGSAARLVPLSPLPAPPHQGVQALAFSHGGRMLAVAYDGGIRLFSVTDPFRPVLLSSLSTSSKEVPTAVAFGGPDGAVLTVGTFDGNLYSWWLRDPARPQSLPSAAPAHGGVAGLGFSPDGRTLAVGSGDGTLSLWDVSFSTGPSQLTSSQAELAEGLTAVTYSPDGSVIATSDADGTARLWTPPHTLLRPSPAEVNDISVSPDGHTAAVAGDYVWLISVADATASFRIRARLSVPGQSISWAALSPAGHLLAAGTRNGLIRMWNVADPARPVVLATLTTGLSAVDSIAFSSDGRTMAAGTVTGDAASNWYWTARVWDVTGPAVPRLLDTVGGRTNSVGNWVGQFTPAGGTLAFATNGDPALRLWNLADPRRPGPISTMSSGSLAATSVAFSADGSLLAVGDIDSSVRVWRTAGRSGPAEVATLRSGTQPVDSVALADGGQIAAAGDNGGTVWLWDLATGTSADTQGQPLVSMPNRFAIFGLAAAGDGLIAADYSGEVEFWNLNPAAAIARICATTGNELTASVWHLYIPQLPYAPPCATS